MDDHSTLLRILLGELVRSCAPRTTILVGYSAGADQFLRMIDSDEGAGVEVSGLLALGPNVGLETCFVSSLYANLDAANPDGMLEVLSALAPSRSLPIWPVVQSYVAQTFGKLGSEIGPLKLYATETIAPFQQPGTDPLAAWFRAARAKIPHIRLVFSDGEAAAAEALLARHLDTNALGDDFAESSFVIERVHHVELSDPVLITRHLEWILGEISDEAGHAHDR